jgi:hypothetical protein
MNLDERYAGWILAAEPNWIDKQGKYANHLLTLLW